ncbi:helix-turn-helix domain-containing protein [Maritalea myrionectae]|uniref:helix-turn-helix domain-containing protein n=1 Tax=Maritalea myrionectae TaxID=454601 RepID=UPI0004886992|nr:AraC family transcriptional regulator [Maritalea myrionectae]
MGGQANNSDQSVNKPMGEAYSAYWDMWLQKGALAVHTQFDLTTKTASPLDTFDQLYEQYGGKAVFDFVAQQGAINGLDVPSLLFSSAKTPADLVHKWQQITQAQSEIRFGSKNSSADFVHLLPSGELVLSPSRIRPANLSRFGAAMLTGVMAHTLQQLSPAGVTVFEAVKAGSTRSIDNITSRADIGFDASSDIIIRCVDAAPKDAPRNKPTPYLHLNHLFNHHNHPLFRQLVHFLDQQSGGHTSIDETAFHLGLSVRTLSRRLHINGISYGRLTRFVRLRKALQLLFVGTPQMDDIAFAANYADRHHMARDFRQMVQLSPTFLRDLLQQNPV